MATCPNLSPPPDTANTSNSLGVRARTVTLRSTLTTSAYRPERTTMRILHVTPTDASLADVDGTLATLQALIGGDIQCIPLGHDSAMYVNENGKYLDLPENSMATRLCLHYRSGLDPQDSGRRPGRRPRNFSTGRC